MIETTSSHTTLSLTHPPSYPFKDGVVRALLDAKASVHTRSIAAGVTPICGAASTFNLPLVELLADRGADIDAVDVENNTTPLWAALNASSDDAARLESLALFERLGANPLIYGQSLLGARGQACSAAVIAAEKAYAQRWVDRAERERRQVEASRFYAIMFELAA